MDHCVVCLSTNVDILSRINFQSSEWQDFRIQRIIEKHLWWWYIKQTPADNLPWICRQCWQELYNFHTFYLKVEKLHRQYDILQTVLNGSTNDNKNRVTLLQVKEEIKLVDCRLQTLKVSTDEFHKNIEIENSSVINESIEISELPAIVLNDEHFSINKDDEELGKKVLSDIWKPCLKQCDESCQDLKTTTQKFGRKIRRKNQITLTKEVKTTSRSVEARKNDEYLAQSEYKFFCHLCDMSLKDFVNLQNHYRLEHKTDGYALCCGKKFHNRSALADHLRVHEDPNYFKCTICDRILANRICYKNHRKFHKDETRERIFRCEKCDKSFFKKAVYDRHILTHIPEVERKFPCDECNRKFAAERLVKQHKVICHQNKYGKFCDICGKTFRERFSFTRHMAEHNGTPVDKVPCDICGLELTNKYLLNRHKKKMHSNENLEEICPYCSKISPNMHAHRQHIKYTHAIERKYSCHLCEKKFKRPLQLKEHISTHTGEPLYTCLYCPQTFISNANMHKHRKTAHPKEWASSHCAALKKNNRSRKF